MARYVGAALREGLAGWQVTDCVVTMNRCTYQPRPTARPSPAAR